MSNYRWEIRNYNEGGITCPFCGWECSLNYNFDNYPKNTNYQIKSGKYGDVASFSSYPEHSIESCGHFIEERDGSVLFEGSFDYY